MSMGIWDAQWNLTLSGEILNLWDYTARFRKAFEESKIIYLEDIFPVILDDREFWVITYHTGKQSMEHLLEWELQKTRDFYVLLTNF